MDRREQHAALLPFADHDLENAAAVVGGEPSKRVVVDTEPVGIIRMNLDKRLGQMRAQSRAQAAAGHGVPLVADAAGVEPQWPARAGLTAQCRNFRRDKTGLAVIGVEVSAGEETRQ